MFKDVLNHANLSLYAQIGLVIFFIAFATIVIRTLLRPRRDIETWAALPLDRSADRSASQKERA